jgi:hypothetical protein
MSERKQSRVRAGYDDSAPPLAFDVWESDNGPVYTGLLDHNGVKIFRNPERNALGFSLSGVK